MKKDADTSKTGGKRLTVAEWTHIESLWAIGDTTLKELAHMYNMNENYLSRALAKRGVLKGSKKDEVKAAVQSQIEQATLNEAAVVAKRIRDTKDEHYKYSSTIAKLAFLKIAQATKDEKRLDSVRDEIRTLKECMQCVDLARKDRFALLGLDRDPDAGEEVEKLVIERMTDDQIEDAQSSRDVELGIDDLDLTDVDSLPRVKDDNG